MCIRDRLRQTVLLTWISAVQATRSSARHHILAILAISARLEHGDLVAAAMPAGSIRLGQAAQRTHDRRNLPGPALVVDVPQRRPDPLLDAVGFVVRRRLPAVERGVVSGDDGELVADRRRQIVGPVAAARVDALAEPEAQTGD